MTAAGNPVRPGEALVWGCIIYSLMVLGCYGLLID